MDTSSGTAANDANGAPLDSWEAPPAPNDGSLMRDETASHMVVGEEAKGDPSKAASNLVTVMPRVGVGVGVGVGGANLKAGVAVAMQREDLVATVAEGKGGEGEHSKEGMREEANGDVVMHEQAVGGGDNNSKEEENGKCEVRVTMETVQAEGNGDGLALDLDHASGGDGKEEENEEIEENYDVDEHQELPISERRKHKRLEVFVGGLDKETTEADLESVFKKVGDVVEVRMMRNPQTGKNKGYAFIRYASAATAKRAAQELERVEIRGRSCGVLPSEENDTLFLGNISKSWKKEMVLEALKNFGIENVEDITLMEDPQIEGINRGFAFVEFNTHKEALNAFRRLQQMDAIFGSDRSAKVAWAQPLNEPDEDIMSQVKSVFVDGMPPTWDEEKVKEHFSKYGVIERIVLARNMLSAKRKDFGFVNYIERDAALSCIEALNNTEIVDGGVKMKVKVMLAKPQTKAKPTKGGPRGGYPSGFRGDHRVGAGLGPGTGIGMGMGMGLGMGMGIRGGMGLLPFNVLSGWGNVPRFENQLRFGGVRERGFGMGNTQRPEKKTKRGGKRNTSTEDLDVKNQLLQAIKDEHTTKVEEKEKKPDGIPLVQEILPNGDSIPASTCALENVEQSIPHAIDVVSKPTLDKFECTMCGFGSDSVNELESHKRTKVHKVIEGLRKDQKLHNKTPLSLLHEYASRSHCEVHYETAAETNGPFEVTAVIGGSLGGTTSVPTKGFGIGRNKARAKQMAAANALEKIMEKVPESEFTKPGQSRQRFSDRERPGRKSKGGGGGGGGGNNGGGGGNRNSRGKSNEDWRSNHGGVNNSFMGLPNLGGIRSGSGKNKRNNNNNNSNLFLAGGGSGAYISNPNAIPLNGYNDFTHSGGRGGFGERLSGRGSGGFNASARGPRGGLATQSLETYAERYDRIQGGRGYGNIGFGGREFMGAGGAIGTGNFNGRDLVESAFGNRDLPPPPPLLNFNNRDLPPSGFVGANRDLEASGMKRPFASMDEETRFVDVQRTLPRQRLEASEQLSIHSNANTQGFGVQPPIFSEIPRPSVVRPLGPPGPPEQPQYNTYVQSQPQGMPISHNIVQPSHHVPTQHPNMSLVMNGVPSITTTQGGTPYSIYDAAPQPSPSLPTNAPISSFYNNHFSHKPHNDATGYTSMNQDYMVNNVSMTEMSQGNSYPSQSTYGAQFGIMQPNMPSQVGSGYTSMQNPVQHQTFY